MRWALFAGLALTVGALAKGQDADDRPLHSEKGIGGPIKIEQREPYFNRLVINGLLWGTQVNEKFVRHWADDANYIVPDSPWHSILAVGVTLAFDPRQEPLSYYHRTGPVGAIFRELHTRKDGADAISSVAILGLGAGTEAVYAKPFQRFTYYEADPALKRLVADTDKYFTYIGDARKRGATIEVRIGDRREKLKDDKDRKYTLILVDQAEGYPFAKDVFSKEAVQLYFDRLTGDGIVALHISNKFFSLEPMFAHLAAELKLEGRIWYDNAERGKPGKTASAWIVLARDKKSLGTLAVPKNEQLNRFGTRFVLLDAVNGIPVLTDAHADPLPYTFHPSFQLLALWLGRPTPLYSR